MISAVVSDLKGLGADEGPASAMFCSTQTLETPFVGLADLAVSLNEVEPRTRSCLHKRRDRVLGTQLIARVSP